MGTANKVQFGLKNVYYALLTEGASTAPTFGTPKKIPGAVTLELSHETAEVNFYADNQAYYRSAKNNGYTGSMTLARFTDDFLKDCCGCGYDTTNKVVFENGAAKPQPFALLFQIDGDQNDDLYVMYRCYATRPNLGSNTMNENGAEPQAQTCDLAVLPLLDPTGGVLNEKVLAKTDESTSTAIRQAWFSTVFTSFSTT